MTTVLKPVDAVVIGFGWAGSILSSELVDAGLQVIALERGPARATPTDFVYPYKNDELKYVQRNAMMVNLAQETLTFRNEMSETALPMRQHGSFLMGTGTGGSGAHWGGVAWRWLPWDHEPFKRVTERHGRSILRDDMLLQDWGLTYADMEPWYDRMERAWAVSGKAGKLDGVIMPGGNPFEGSRAREYPNPALTPSPAMTIMMEAATRLGFHPFISPAAISSQPYLSPDGVQYGVCHYNGFCERFGCPSNAKASPNHTILSQLSAKPGFVLKNNATVMKVNLDRSGKRATGVTYIDALGREFIQPADIVILTAYGLGNVHLMLLSGIGAPYDPVSGSGVVGKNYAYQCQGGVTAFMPESTWLNPWMGSGGLQAALDDFNVEANDAQKLGFIGGATIATASNGSRPIAFRPTPKGTPEWGTDWKRAVVKHFQHTFMISAQGSGMSYRKNYLDLDPTYRDAFGRPMLRMTFDFDPNEVRMAEYAIDQCERIAKEAGATQIDRRSAPKRYSIVPYQSTHNTGGAIMGVDPATSALNTALQSWDVSNVFVVGANALPQNAGKNPTGPVGALAYRTADTIRRHYLKSPGLLA
ncbi:GMC family oxidoreductase (plasmid) [Cupriavidus pinatubonensis]|uniref:GMC family oxidoreductase n=1 Tax=Cupriavidus pinatubonensis TaxID=248026 RepID=UPI001C72D242|nr:GMC family oxidoreductase [Cupriavidus pinatubonensis]QYY33791.1 GMC family oxidoreductase [Cupriavidus pinatubonensis]